MIVFLTLIYIFVLVILLKLKIIKLTLWWKMSPIVWMLSLFIVLFVPMQWGAPGGTVVVYQGVVEVIPNVSGEVIEVVAEALTPLKKDDVIFKIDPEPFQNKLDKVKASLKLSTANLKRARSLYKKKLGPEIDVERYTAEVEQFTAELALTQYDLTETVVRAPDDGYVLGLSLRPGQRVANIPLRSWVTFVNSNVSRVAIGINQNVGRNVAIGQQAEVTFKVLPGKVFTATVEKIAPITQSGQLSPTGNVPLAPTAQDIPLPFAVILKLDDDAFVTAGLTALDISSIPGGALGTGAIYTKSGEATHIIRKIMVRMDAWLNYLTPI